MDKSSTPLLIIFYRNPIAGKVKTRLAATVGDQKALEIYRKLALHTKEVTENLPFDKIVFYSESIDLKDMWPNASYSKSLQRGDDLGERMEKAFAAGFETGYASICIIGTDCYELTAECIRQAFTALESADAVIGPAHDGGYYLLGLKKPNPQIFQNKHWSTDRVYNDTVRDLESLGLRYVTLPKLKDVDTEDDLPEKWND